MRRAAAILASSALVLSMGAKGGCETETPSHHNGHGRSTESVGKRAAVSVGGTKGTYIRVSYLLDPHVGTRSLIVKPGWVSNNVRITQHTVITVNAIVLHKGGTAICAIYVDRKKIDQATATGKGKIAYCKTNFVPPATIQGEL